jgi:hypothetical protein
MEVKMGWVGMKSEKSREDSGNARKLKAREVWINHILFACTANWMEIMGQVSSRKFKHEDLGRVNSERNFPGPK